MMAGVSSLCPAIVKMLPGVSSRATEEIRCRNAGQEGNRVRLDKDPRNQRAWRLPLRTRLRRERLRHRKTTRPKGRNDEAMLKYDTAKEAISRVRAIDGRKGP